jgi:hypothetical protein
LKSYRDLANTRCRSTPPCPLFADAFLLAQQEERRQIILEHRRNLVAAADGPFVFDFGLPDDVNLIDVYAQLMEEREARRAQHILEMEQAEARARRHSARRSISSNMNAMDCINDQCKFASIAANDRLISISASLLSLRQGAWCLDQCILD